MCPHPLIPTHPRTRTRTHTRTHAQSRVLLTCGWRRVRRNWDDIQCNWDSLASIIDHWGDYGPTLQQWAGPGHFNDPDMLLIGNTYVGCGVMHPMCAPGRSMGYPAKCGRFDTQLLHVWCRVAADASLTTRRARRWRCGAFSVSSLWLALFRGCPRSSPCHHTACVATPGGTFAVSVAFQRPH